MSEIADELRDHEGIDGDFGIHTLREAAAEHIDNLEERLQRIEQWCKAYPRDIFIEPTKKQWKIADETLAAHKGDDCPSLTAISGSNMRHVVEGLMAQAKDWEA